MTRLLALCGALYAASGVALGAFGAHALRDRLAPRLLEAWQTAVQYQLLHALGLLLVTLFLLRFPDSRLLGWGGLALATGVVLFSGSIYGLAAGLRFLGPVTPVGGTLFIVGWLLVAVGLGSALKP